MGQHKEALECAKECYCLYPTSHTHPPAIEASFALIESCLHNKEFEDAELYARTTWETITLSRDSHIPDDTRDWFTARGAHYLAAAMLRLAQNRDIPPEENQTVGKEAIGLARRALKIDTQLHGFEHSNVADAMSLLANARDYFNNVDDDEVFRLHEQSIAIQARVEGSMSVNVAAGNQSLGVAYYRRAKRDVNDVDRVMANLNLALPHYREAVRIYRHNNYMGRAEESEKAAVAIEKSVQRGVFARAVAAATTRAEH